MIETRTPRTILPPPPDTEGILGSRDAVDRRGAALDETFDRAVVADPTMLDDIPHGALVILVPTDDPELADREIAAGMAWLRQGMDVYFRHLGADRAIER